VRSKSEPNDEVLTVEEAAAFPRVRENASKDEIKIWRFAENRFRIAHPPEGLSRVGIHARNFKSAPFSSGNLMLSRSPSQAMSSFLSFTT
jgi:hypothetical protein